MSKVYQKGRSLGQKEKEREVLRKIMVWAKALKD